MKELNTSLLREKFVIHDSGAGKDKKKDSVIALSNRMVIELPADDGASVETLIIRSHNMHSCVRMAARMVHDFIQTGPILDRQPSYDWEAAWNSIVNEYEYAYNPQRWIAVYHNGKPIFERGMRHPLLDVIEKCDQKNPGPYDLAIPMAEGVFKQAGKTVSIEYDGNVALVVHLGAEQGRIGVIIRGPNRTTTFNFSATARPGNELRFPLCLSAAASFLEGIQIAFMVGFNEEKIKLGIIDRFSKEEKQTLEAKRRLSRLNSEIANLEAQCTVRYRPERPEFHHILMDAEKLAQKILAPAE